MPNPDDSTPTNAFNPDYLRQLDQHDDPVTAGEAVTGSFWRVVPLGAESVWTPAHSAGRRAGDSGVL